MKTPHPDSGQTLYDLAKRLRDLVNRVRRHERLWRGPTRDWHVVTSGLDMVQDTAWALETYAGEVDDLNEDKPHAYIRIFGVLNRAGHSAGRGFSVIQGSLGRRRLSSNSPLPARGPSSIPSLARARQIRIAGAGHPVEWGKKKNFPTSTFIVQQSVNSRGCQLILRRHDGKTEWQHISLKALIEGQHKTLAEQCRMAITELKADDEEHRMKYVSTPLTSIFKACDYWTPKVALAVYDSEPSELGLGGLQTVEDALQRFPDSTDRA